ncbi:MAG TPA: hypothetical protein VNT03_00010 [Baekduia sp.]|nr:hypothetical protein [Baekduia sp.]
MIPVLAALTLLPASAAHAKLSAPRPESPADGAAVQAAPLMSWRAVSGAKRYDVQVAADKAFGSLVDRLRPSTNNTATSLETTLADGAYFWRVRPIDSADKAGRWSAVRSFRKAWTAAPEQQSPAPGGVFAWPMNPLVISWAPVPYATKYLVTVATDRSLATPIGNGKPIETSATSLAVPFTLNAGEYSWSVQPVDADGHRGAVSPVRAFSWAWNAQTATRVTDTNDRPEVFDPLLNWDAVAGAARYDVQVSSEDGFGPASVVFQETVTGTAVAPLVALPNNNRWYWRMRAVDPDGRAGAWQTGPSFLKPFDDPDPATPGDQTIENLHLRGHASSAALAPGSALDDPMLAWDPVPGAADYEVRVVPQRTSGDPSAAFCDWGATGALKVRTPVPYLDVADRASPTPNPWPLTWPTPTVMRHLLPAGPYCARVLASDGAGNDSIATQLGSDTTPAFTVQSSVPAPSCTPIAMTADDLLEPAAGAHVTRTPLFTWSAKPGAVSYWVAVSRDASFTDVVDVALVDRPLYVPRVNYADEDGNLYWAVIASPTASGSCSAATATTLAARAHVFSKVSSPPTLLDPGPGADTPQQPVFRWNTAEGAASYRVQVARDREFRDVIDNQVTASTAYAAAATYPVDTQLYWRVRPRVCDGTFGNGACMRFLELRGSDVTDLRTFRRTLTVPALDAGNATGGEVIPVFSWGPVFGAISYDVHIDQADGTTKDFTVAAPRFTPTGWYGTGVWSWRVRANFASLTPSVKAQSAYSAPMRYVRRIAPPSDPRISHGNHRLSFAWTPDAAATKYRVQISATDSFTRILEQVTTPSTAWAPSLTNAAFAEGGRLFWRMQILDSGSQEGAWRNGVVNLPRGLRVNVRGMLRRKRTNTVTVVVTNRGKGIARATVRASGKGIRVRRRTDKKGQAVLRIRVRRGGTVRFTAQRKSYATGRASVVVLGS